MVFCMEEEAKKLRDYVEKEYIVESECEGTEGVV